jgi:hypothetical protein
LGQYKNTRTQKTHPNAKQKVKCSTLFSEGQLSTFKHSTFCIRHSPPAELCSAALRKGLQRLLFCLQKSLSGKPDPARLCLPGYAQKKPKKKPVIAPAFLSFT